MAYKQVLEVECSQGLVWSEQIVKMEQYHVRFEKADSECGSESSWYSYMSSGNVPVLAHKVTD